MIKERKLAIEILEEFESLLEGNDLTIPDRDREGNEEEARLYGGAYYRLEDRIVEILSKDKDEFTKIVTEKIDKIKNKIK